MPTHGPEKVESIRASVDSPFSLEFKCLTSDLIFQAKCRGLDQPVLLWIFVGQAAHPFLLLHCRYFSLRTGMHGGGGLVI
jgi:hypothetical protein